MVKIRSNNNASKLGGKAGPLTGESGSRSLPQFALPGPESRFPPKFGRWVRSLSGLSLEPGFFSFTSLAQREGRPLSHWNKM